MKPLNRFLAATHDQLSSLTQEVSELRTHSQAVLSEKQDIEAVLFSISEAVLVTNRYDELLLANEPAEQLLGFSFGQSYLSRIEEILSDETLVMLIRQTRRGEPGHRRRVFEHTIECNGRLHTFSVTLSGLMSPTDQINGVAAVLHDVTREREIGQLKTDFVSNVSHELKTPLASITAYLEMLRDGQAKDEQTRMQFYDIMSGEADRLHRLIDNVLNIARIESDAISANPRAVALTEVVREAIPVMISQAHAKQIELIDALGDDDQLVLADRELIYEVIVNLLSNAVKYTPRGGRVSVQVRSDQVRGVAVCEVSDNGVGIPAEEIPNIFEKFYRVRANNRLAEGTGLGLALVKHIVETLSNGHVSVQSEVGKGSSFSFELPLCAPEAATVSQEESVRV